MMIAAAVCAVWFLIGCVVASRSIPWRDVSFHATFARMTTTAAGAPVSPWADRLFFVLAALLWPLSCRWRRLGAFRAPSSESREDLTEAGARGSVGMHGDGHRQSAFSDPLEPGDRAP